MFRELTRKKQKLTVAECVALLESERRGVLSVSGDDGYPYGMPMNHFYHAADGKIYFHSGKGGHRLDALRKHDKACFCVYGDDSRESGEWAWRVKSVIVFGRVAVVDDPITVADITARLSRKFTDDEEYIRRELAQYAHDTLLLVLTPEHMCGKLVTEA